MITKVVLDASVVLKWFSRKDEELVAEAKEVYSKIVESKLEAWAPELLLTEVLNILARKKKLEGRFLSQVMERLKQVGIVWVRVGKDEIDELTRVVRKYKVTAYDGQYLWLAGKQKCQLLTTDKELLKIKKIIIKLEDYEKC